MATKKRAAKKVEPRPAVSADRERISGPEYRDGAVYFSERDLATYELARARFETTVVMSEVIAHRIEKERREANERILSLRNDQAAKIKEQEKLRAEVVSLEAEINAKYGIDLTTITYDEKTGKINQLSEGSNGTT